MWTSFYLFSISESNLSFVLRVDEYAVKHAYARSFSRKIYMPRRCRSLEGGPFKINARIEQHKMRTQTAREEEYAKREQRKPVVCQCSNEEMEVKKKKRIQQPSLLQSSDLLESPALGPKYP